MKWLQYGLLLLPLLTPGSLAFAACQLSKGDFESLRASRSKIENQTQVDALDASRQERLCKTRANYAKYHVQGGGLQSSSELNIAYLSPTELEEYNKWLDVLLNKLMSAPGADKALRDLRENFRKDKK